ncbi:MAG: HD domain-containing protein [Nanoarchaeota archaeon]|nr:HD domain-containing protein [Nanoarchaeota archaeon]
MNKNSITSIINHVEKIVKKDYSGELHHGWAHLNRVRNYAVYIAEKEGADAFIVELAALMHDIAKIKYGSTVKNHAKKGALMAGIILEKLDLDNNTIKKVCSCINTHSRREPPKPKTLEEKCLFDADGLELVGTVGILRTALYAAYYDKTWNDMLRKVGSRISKAKFYTSTGKKIAKKRIKFVKKFYEKMELELNWKKENKKKKD